MKKIIVLFLSLLIVFCLCGCSKNETASENEEETVVSEETKPQTNTESAENVKQTETKSITSSSNGTPKTATNTTPSQNTVPSQSTPTPIAESKRDINGLFDYLKSFVIEKGHTNGDYVSYSKSSDNYGGLSSENFALYYWGDTDTIEFSLHSVVDETYSYCFYIRIPKTYSGKYEYISSFYYRDNGQSVCESKGMITASEFTKNYPLNSTKYTGPSNMQNNFMEESRKGICDTLDCLREFMSVEKLEYTFSDLGFTKF